MTKIPKAIERLAKQEQWTEAALDKATAPLGGTEPEPERGSAAAAFTARMTEQRQQEDEHEARVRRLMHEHPDPPLDEPDPLRSLAREQRAHRRQVKRRLPR